MRAERLDQLEEYIINSKTVSLDKLMEVFGVSRNTVRRDVDALLERGRIEKVYGGVRSIQKPPEDPKIILPYRERFSRNRELKRMIAREAVNYIENDDTLFFDTGSSIIDMVDFLDDFSNLTIVTNSITIMMRALEHPQLNVLGLPGVINNKTASLVGHNCVEALRRYNIKKAFMACTAIAECGASNATIEESEIKKVVIEQSADCFVLVDHTKFSKISLTVYCPLSNIDYLITDEMPEEKYLKLFKENNIKLCLAGSDR